jgi:hypothetical protein
MSLLGRVTAAVRQRRRRRRHRHARSRANATRLPLSRRERHVRHQVYCCMYQAGNRVHASEHLCFIGATDAATWSVNGSFASLSCACIKLSPKRFGYGGRRRRRSRAPAAVATREQDSAIASGSYRCRRLEVRTELRLQRLLDRRIGRAVAPIRLVRNPRRGVGGNGGGDLNPWRHPKIEPLSA